MNGGFDFELYETLFKNCFVHSSSYTNGSLKLSLFGVDPKVDETAHFADITLEQNKRTLKDNEIVVDCKFKPTLIPQLKKLKILKDQVGVCVIGNTFYPIYTINLTKSNRNCYCMQELVAA